MKHVIFLITVLTQVASCSSVKRGYKEKTVLFKDLDSKDKLAFRYITDGLNCFEDKDIDDRKIITVPIQYYQLALYKLHDHILTFDIKVITKNGHTYKEIKPYGESRITVEAAYCQETQGLFTKYKTTHVSFRIAKNQ